MSPCDTSGCKRIRTTCSVQDETSRLHQRLHMLRTLRIGSMELRGRLYRNVQKADPDLSRTVIVNIQSLVANCLNWDLPMMWWISLGQAGLLTSFLLTNLVVRFTSLFPAGEWIDIIWTMTMITDLKMTKSLLQRVLLLPKVSISPSSVLY